MSREQLAGIERCWTSWAVFKWCFYEQFGAERGNLFALSNGSSVRIALKSRALFNLRRTSDSYNVELKLRLL